MLLAIPPDDIGKVWEQVEPELDRAFRLTRKIETHELREALEIGYGQLWVVWNNTTKEQWAVVLSDIQSFYGGRKCARIVGLAGKGFELWRHLILDIEVWAVNEGCDAIEIVGRKGWARMFPDYDPIEYVLSKELSNGQLWQ
jgi:hypothetical protein